jgi:hypothetical protein
MGIKVRRSHCVGLLARFPGVKHHRYQPARIHMACMSLAGSCGGIGKTCPHVAPITSPVVFGLRMLHHQRNVYPVHEADAGRDPPEAGTASIRLGTSG